MNTSTAKIEFIDVEVPAIEVAPVLVPAEQLQDLQLAVVGGGTGDVCF